MIKVIPSVTISHGRTAKLPHGPRGIPQYYDKDPLDLAKFFEDHGANWLHLVDLDGASGEEVQNAHVLQIIAGQTNLRVNFAGGIRTDGGVAQAFESGAKTVTVATTAALDRQLFTDWLITFGANRMVLGADVGENNHIVTSGWHSRTEIDLWEHIEYFHERSVQFIKITDVMRDGVLEGPNFDLYRQAVERFPKAHIIASGGVRSIADIEELDKIGIWGVIIARAFYEDKLPIDDLKPFFAA